MSRYIDADRLLGEMDKRYIEKKGNVPDNLAEGFLQMEILIKKQPTADVVEVVHGEWSPTGGETLFLREFRCNRCKSRQLGNTNYCPNCGAKMDGKKVE